MRVFELAWKTLLLLLCSVVLALAALMAALHFNPHSLTPLVERGATYFLGRDLHLEELARVSLGEDTVLELRGLELANASWAGPSPMLSVGSFKLVLSLPSLWLGGSILVRHAEIDQLTLELLAPEGQDPNWVLPIKLGSSEPREEGDEVLFPVTIEQLQLLGISIGYTDPNRQVDTRVEQLQLSSDETTGLSTLSLAGVVNELPLSGEGVIGPVEALQTGRNLELDLKLKLGELQVAAKGSVADALAMEGADFALNIRAPRSRPVLDLLGLQEVRDGPLVFEGQLADASPGVRIEAEGELAEFGMGAHGVIEDPRALDGIELSFYLDGPSMAEAGIIWGVVGFKGVPFDLSGELYRRGSVLKIEKGEFRAAQTSVSLSGVLPAFPEIDDWKVDLQAKQLELSALGPIAGVEGLPELLCDVEGRLFSDGQGVELVDLHVTSDDLELVVSGAVDEQPDYFNTDLKLQFSGNDLTDLQPLIGLETLPAAPYELAGELSHDSSGWRIEKAHLLVLGFRADVSADLDSLANFQRLDGRISVSSPDIPTALRDYGIEVETNEPLPLRLDSEVRLDGGGFELSAVEGKIGAIEVSGNGWLSAAEDFAGSRVTLAAHAESTGEALAAFVDADLPGEPFKLSLDATYHSPLVSIDRLQAFIGSHTLAGHLSLSGHGEQQLARGQLSLEGKSLKNLMALLGLEREMADGSYRASSALKMSASHLAVQGLHVAGANSDLSGDLRLEFGEVPRLDVNLHSQEIHLSSLFPRLDSERATEPPPEESPKSNLMDLPTSKQMKERLIPDTPLPLAWINRISGRWRYSVGRAYERRNADSRLVLDIDVGGGILKTRELGWEGVASKGWIDLTIDARQTPYRIDMELASDRIPLLWLVSGKEVPKQKSTYRGSYAAVGTTVREAVASLDGELILHGSGAQLSNNGLDLILGDTVGSVFDRLNPFAETETYTNVECLAGAMQAKEGVLSIDPGMVIRTDKVDVISGGTVDLGTEALDIAFNTRSRKGIGISVGKAITPYLKVAGNLANPWLTVDPEAVVLSGTAAVATVGMSILAESLYDRWIGTAKSPCKEIFKKIRKHPDYKPLLAFRQPGLTNQAQAPSK